MADDKRVKSKGQILVVEDETFLRELYEELLTSEGYTVDTADDGVVAVEFISDKSYDVTLLDIMLPHKDGFQVMEESKEAGQFEKFGKIMLLTVLGQEAVIKRGFDLGAVGYLFKDEYTPNQVLEEVGNLFSET